MIKTRMSVVLAATAFVVVAGCSDQGAVKSESAKAPAPVAAAQTPARTAPPLASSRMDPNTPLPPGHPPIDQNSASALPPVPAGAGQGDAALAWTVPPSWISVKPASAMRRAQYKVPGKAGDGECVVFYFGPGQGGDPMSNAQRWASQFSLADGSSAEKNMKTSEIEVGGLKVFLVELAGTYSGGMSMTAEPAKPMPDYRLLGAVAPGPDANWFFKFTGPDATVNAQRAAFESMVKSLKHGA